MKCGGKGKSRLELLTKVQEASRQGKSTRKLTVGRCHSKMDTQGPTDSNVPPEPPQIAPKRHYPSTFELENAETMCCLNSTWYKYILIGVVPVSPKNNIGISETCSFCNRAFAAPPRPLLASLVLRVFSCFRSRRPKDDSMIWKGYVIQASPGLWPGSEMHEAF